MAGAGEMTMPDSSGTDGLQGQVLIKLGEIGADVKVIQKTLEAIPDHENRIRIIENAAAQNRGGRDMAARWWAAAAVLAAAGSGTAAWVAIITHR